MKILIIVFFSFNCNRITVILANASGIAWLPDVKVMFLKQYTIIIVIIAGAIFA